MPADYMHLSSVINQHREFRLTISSLRPGRLSEEKKAMLKALSPRIERYLGSDTVALNAWSEFMNSIAEGYIFPLTPTPRQVIAATLLNGAAIKKPGLQLRSGLQPELYQARADFQRSEVRISPPQGGATPLLYRPRPNMSGVESPQQKTLVGDYNILTKRMRSGGKLDSAIQKLLTDPSRSLAPLGSMRTLDAVTIEIERTNTLLSKAEPRINPIFVEEKRSTTAYAPKSMSLSLNRFRCVRQQESTGSDEIFWAGNFVRCTNLAEVYAEIERLMKQTNPSDFKLNFQWAHSTFVRPKERGGLFKIKTGSDWLVFGANSIVFEQQLYNGFGPWAGTVYCIEDDDAEYDAVGEVFDTFGDYAEAVSQGAAIVSGTLAAGGVTGPAAAAAAAISAGAGAAKLGADLAGAVVDIVNFFDDDDMIDSINLSGPGDYAVRSKQEVQTETDSGISDLKESARGAHYQLELATNYSDMAEFQRTWGCSVQTNWFPADGGWYEKSGGPFGDSGEIERTVTYNPPVQILQAGDEEKGGESAPGHAEVMSGYPKLERNGTLGRVKVHWGRSAFGSMKFKFYLQAFRFTKKL